MSRLDEAVVVPLAVLVGVGVIEELALVFEGIGGIKARRT